MFQSLFSWKSPSDSESPPMVTIWSISFNPCFRGSRPRTSSFLPCSCFARWFQSLFSWKSPSDVSCGVEVVFPLGVSILVFVEVALGQQLERTPWMSSWSFNPCFRGSRPRTTGSPKPLISEKEGFNPCFRGSRPRTSLAGPIGPSQIPFQSLFSWKSPSDRSFGLA